MRVIVIGAAGHIGTYLIPMLVDNGYETTAITRTMSQPYEDAPAWHKSRAGVTGQGKLTRILFSN